MVCEGLTRRRGARTGVSVKSTDRPDAKAPPTEPALCRRGPSRYLSPARRFRRAPEAQSRTMTATLAPLADADGTALFLDFDGTLVDFADHPDAVALDPPIREALARLARRLSGAVAIITGRDIADIDRYLTPLHLPVAGVHGLIRRDGNGTLHQGAADLAAAEALYNRLTDWAAAEAGLVVEHKPGAVALHYRQRPELEQVCTARMEAEAGGLHAFRLMRGKCVLELKTGGRDKGMAVADFMAEPPFAGRLPVFAGDDVTDEDAFAQVNAQGGVSIKIGEGNTIANHRANSSEIFRLWLMDSADRLDQEKAG